MGNANVLQFTAEFTHIGPCATCGIDIVLPEHYGRARRNDHGTFYCPNGHSQYFPGKSEAEKLRAELEAERAAKLRAYERESELRARKEHVERQLNGTRGALAKMKKRVANGVCPLCNRTLKDLQKHMTCKHPEYVAEVSR